MHRHQPVFGPPDTEGQGLDALALAQRPQLHARKRPLLFPIRDTVVKACAGFERSEGPVVATVVGRVEQR